jgi:hypothetical protein
MWQMALITVAANQNIRPYALIGHNQFGNGLREATISKYAGTKTAKFGLTQLATNLTRPRDSSAPTPRFKFR